MPEIREFQPVGEDLCRSAAVCINKYDISPEKAEETISFSEQSVPDPGRRPGFLLNFLADMGVKVTISGGMGGAVDIFNERDVEVIQSWLYRPTFAVDLDPRALSVTSTDMQMSAAGIDIIAYCKRKRGNKNGKMEMYCMWSYS